MGSFTSQKIVDHSLILPSVIDEFKFKTSFLSLAVNAGLFVGVRWCRILGFWLRCLGEAVCMSMAIVTAKKNDLPLNFVFV